MVTMRAKRAAACLLWMSDWPITKIERTLTQYIPGNDAAGDLRSVVNRTLDLVPSAIEVAAILRPEFEVGDRQADLLARLQLGLPASLAPLGRLAGAKDGQWR
jgi:helicase